MIAHLPRRRAPGLLPVALRHRPGRRHLRRQLRRRLRGHRSCGQLRRRLRGHGARVPPRCETRRRARLLSSCGGCSASGASGVGEVRGEHQPLPLFGGMCLLQGLLLHGLLLLRSRLVGRRVLLHRRVLLRVAVLLLHGRLLRRGLLLVRRGRLLLVMRRGLLLRCGGEVLRVLRVLRVLLRPLLLSHVGGLGVLRLIHGLQRLRVARRVVAPAHALPVVRLRVRSTRVLLRLPVARNRAGSRVALRGIGPAALRRIAAAGARCDFLVLRGGLDYCRAGFDKNTVHSFCEFFFEKRIVRWGLHCTTSDRSSVEFPKTHISAKKSFRGGVIIIEH